MLKNIKPREMYVAIFIFSLAIVAMTKNLFMPNTGDFGRAIGWYLTSLDGQYFTLKIGDVSAHNFINGFDYKSSYTLLVYFYTVILSYFTDFFDLRLLSAILKITYIFSLFHLFSKVMWLDGEYNKAPSLRFLVFLFAMVPCISSSNLAFFSSFYQEQVVLICLPILLFCLIAEKQKYFLVVVAVVTVISCSKSQFFYFPLIVALYYWFYKDRDVKKILAMVAIFILACTAIIKTTTTELNKYHATYFGVYQLAEINGYDIPESVKRTCVGVDAWGNKFNLEYGAIDTGVGMACYNELKDKVSFFDVVKFFIKNPRAIFSLPFDKGILPQLSENYFHVYFGYKIIGGNTGALAKLTVLKDALFHGGKLPTLLFALSLCILFRKKMISGVCFILASFSITQFYISFIGEGYRDLSKHLFAMNFSFDLIVSIIIVLCLLKIINKIVGDASNQLK